MDMLQAAASTSPAAAIGIPNARNLIDSRNYVLHYGLKDKKLRKMQTEAYLKTQQKIVTRGDSARAMVLSANSLGMSVMTSQLSMYRWKVSEAQSMTQATSRLQEEVMEALKKGYQVRRTNMKPPKGRSKYADKKALERLFALKMEQIQRRKERREQRKEAAAAAGEDLAMALVDVVDSESVSLSDVSSDESSAHSGNSSVCSVERLPEGEEPAADGRRRNTPPSDMVSSVVIVDSFTHEPYEEIIEHLRYIDHRYDLNMVIILLLPKNDDARDLQGAGQVITPDHTFAMEDAYSRGYDLVLTHYFDHVVVEFLTDTFVSSSGRWRNDVRAKAAVGNYISLKNILMGRIDINVLKQLAWDEEIDDAGLLDVIGQHSLALHGENKRIGLAGQTLSKGQVTLGPSNAAGDGPLGVTAAGDQMTLPTTLSRYRQRQRNVHGVTVKKDVFTALDEMGDSASSRGRDMLGFMMSPSSGVAQHTVRRRRKNADPEDESEDAYEYVLVTVEDQNKNIIQGAFENEMTRLIAENDQKTKMINMLTGDVERLTRTVAALKKGNSGEEGQKYMDAGDRDPFTGSLMNLSKEQQIYILKERLDMANEQIATMMEDGNQRRSRSGNSRDGPNNSWNSVQDRAGGGGSSGRVNKKLQARKLRMYRSYAERRENEMMRLMDYDAEEVESMRRRLGTGAGSSRAASEGPPGASRASSRRQAPSRKNESAEERRRRNDNADKVVSQLKSALDNSSSEPGGASSTLQSAMELIQSQQKRVAMLEEMMKSNNSLLDSTQAELKQARLAKGMSDSDTGGGGGGGKKKKGARKSVTSIESASGRGEGSDVPGAAKRRRSLPKGKRAGEGGGLSAADQEAIQKAIREEVLHEAEIETQKALQSLERKHRAQLKKRGVVIKKILQRLYLKIRKPYTEEYVEELQRQRQQALGDALGVKQRLMYMLGSIRPDNLVPEEDQQKEGSEWKGVVSRLRDPENAREVQQLAREYATHAYRARELEKEMEEISAKLVTTKAGEAEFLDALNYWEQNKAHREKLGKTNPDLTAYLKGLEDELEAENAVMRWGAPSVNAVIEKGLERKDALQGTLTFNGQSLHSPRFDRRSGKWRLAAAGTASPSTDEDGEDEAFNDMASTLYLRDDPVLADMHRVFVAVTHPEMDEVLASEGMPLTSAKPRRRAGKRAAAGQSDEDDQLDSDDEAAASGGGKRKPPAHAEEEAAGTFLTGTGILGSSRPPLAPSGRGSPGSLRDAIARLSSRSSSLANSKEFGIDRVMSGSRGGGSMSQTGKSSISSYSPFSEHPGVVHQLLQNDAGEAKIELYNSALNSYRSGYVHPDRMLDVERSAQSPEAVGRELSAHYLAHHQELLRLLQLLALRTPALGAVLEHHTEELEAKVAEDLRRAESSSSTGDDDEDSNAKENRAKRRNGGVTVPFLMSYDTAAVTWYVDYLCRTMPEHKTAVGTAAAGGEDLRPNRSLRHLKPNDERLQMYEDVVTVLTQPYGLAALGDEAWASQVERPGGKNSTSARRSGAALNDGSSERSASTPRNLVEVRQRPSSGTPGVGGTSKSSLGGRQSLWTVGGSSLSGEAHNTADMSHIPEDVAALFSRQLQPGNSAMTAAELYLETELDKEGDEEDENLQLMKDIKLELAYLSQLREERMAELRLRYKYRQKQIQLREKNKYEGWDKDQEDADASPREVPDFEVKGGSAAWYGMEAAKRVKDILKRKQRPDQIILGSGGVGVELSKRMAFPRAPQQELDVMQSIEERMRAAHRVLPPLRRRGLSKWQQQFYKGLPQPEDLGYIDPREEAIVNAFGRMARINHRQDGVTYLRDPRDNEELLPAGLSERVLAFRESLQHIGLRRHAAGGGAEGRHRYHQPDSPFYQVVATSPIPAPSVNPSDISEAVRQKTMARLDLTSWVYGVPASDLQVALEKPAPSPDSLAEDGKVGVVFLPNGGRGRPSRNTAAQMNRTAPAGMSMVDGNRAGGRRILPNQNSIYNPYRSLGPEQFVTPSALAAQRLSMMLRASANDPSVTGRSGFYAGSSVSGERWFQRRVSASSPGSPITPGLEESIPLLGRSSVQRGPVAGVQGKAATFLSRTRSGHSTATPGAASSAATSTANLHGTLTPSASGSLSPSHAMLPHPPERVPNPPAPADAPGGAAFHRTNTITPQSSAEEVDPLAMTSPCGPAPSSAFDCTIAPSTQQPTPRSPGNSSTEDGLPHIRGKGSPS